MVEVLVEIMGLAFVCILVAISNMNAKKREHRKAQHWQEELQKIDERHQSELKEREEHTRRLSMVTDSQLEKLRHEGYQVNSNVAGGIPAIIHRMESLISLWRLSPYNLKYHDYLYSHKKNNYIISLLWYEKHGLVFPKPMRDYFMDILQ